jgi:hypothetical protein
MIEPRFVCALADGDRSILMPANRPIRLFTLVERDRSDWLCAGPEYGLGRP